MKLAENVMHFARVLRGAGIPVGPDRVIDALRALDAIRPSDPLRPDADRLRAEIQRELLLQVSTHLEQGTGPLTSTAPPPVESGP